MEVRRVPPLYEQLATVLEDAIMRGAFPEGRLPVERALSEKYQVSRAVVNGAMGLLEKKGLILRQSRRGGTLIRRDIAKFRKAKPLILVVYARSRMAELRHSNMSSMIIEHLLQRADELGYQVEVHPYADSESWPMKVISTSSSLVGGVTFLHADAELLRRVFTAGQKIVSVDHCIYVPGGGMPCPDVCYVESDNFDAGLQVGKLLRGQGHRKVALYGFNVPEYPTCQERLAGLQEGGIPMDPQYVIHTDGEETRIADCVQAGVTAIVAYNDHDAIICLNRLMRAGFRVPEDVSLITFDNIHPLLDELSPRISAMEMPVRNMAEAVWEYLVGEEDPAPRVRRLPYALIQKESVCSRPGPALRGKA
jgi:DNA-binding LacI/PurR family transcriptional regulator